MEQQLNQSSSQAEAATHRDAQVTLNSSAAAATSSAATGASAKAQLAAGRQAADSIRSLMDYVAWMVAQSDAAAGVRGAPLAQDLAAVSVAAGRMQVAA